MGTVMIMRMDGKCEYRQECWQVQVAVRIYAYRLNVHPEGCILTQEKTCIHVVFPEICTHKKANNEPRPLQSHMEDTDVRIYLYVLVSL